MAEFDDELFFRVLDNLMSEDLTNCQSLSVVAMSRAKHWCFTFNNYTQDDIDFIVENADEFDYVVFGKEVGASGTPHLQGFVSFPNRVRMAYATEKIGGGHFSVARHISQSIAYCKKDGDFIEIGTAPDVSSQSGKRNDLESFKYAVKTGTLEMKKLRENFSEVWAKYPTFCRDYVNDHLPKKQVEYHVLRPWQSALYDNLKHNPNPRSIFFIVDPVGNAGKSWFGHYYCHLHDNAQVLLPGKKADMSYILDPLIRVLFIDAPRSKQGEFLQYDFLEDVKNGYVFCSKYESRIKQLGPTHVVVFMNEEPDMNKLSADRYVIRRVSG